MARNTAEEEAEDMMKVEEVEEEIVWQQEPEDVYDDALEADLILQLQAVAEELSQHYNKSYRRVLKSSLDTLTSWASVELKCQCRPLARLEPRPTPAMPLMKYRALELDVCIERL